MSGGYPSASIIAPGPRLEFTSYTYDLRTTLAMRGAGGCLTTKKRPWCGAVLLRCGVVFVDLFHFLLLFVTACNFYKLLFIVEIGVKFVTFFYFFIVCNFHKLLFTVEKGQGLYFVHCARGERVHLDFFPSFFFTVKGEGGGG